MKPSIAMVGVGRMGSAMVQRLKDTGFPIAAVYDANETLAKTVAEAVGAPYYSSLRQVTAHANIIITVVTDDAAMADIYEKSEDSLLMGAKGKLFINCATITPTVHIRLKKLADEVGAEMLECPMASSITQAQQGTLYLMCAGEKAVYERAQSVLEALSTSSVFTGDVGTASSLKALVNMVMNINTAGLAEGLGLADAMGLDLNVVRQVFSETGANSRVLQTDGEDMQNRDHDTYFSAAHAAKDSGIALALGQSCGLSLPLAKATKQQYDSMVEQGLGDLDKSGISELTFLSRLKALQK